MWRIEWTGVGKLGLSDWELRPCLFACYLQQWALHKMTPQIATASFTVVFAAMLVLISYRFVDSRASNSNLAAATRSAVTQIATLPQLLMRRRQDGFDGHHMYASGPK